jgi:hypothetical protein
MYCSLSLYLFNCISVSFSLSQISFGSPLFLSLTLSICIFSFYICLPLCLILLTLQSLFVSISSFVSFYLPFTASLPVFCSFFSLSLSLLSLLSILSLFLSICNSICRLYCLILFLFVYFLWLSLPFFFLPRYTSVPLFQFFSYISHSLCARVHESVYDFIPSPFFLPLFKGVSRRPFHYSY